MAVACYWAFWNIEPTVPGLWLLTMAIGLIRVLAGFFALVNSMFAMFEWMGVESGGTELKIGE